MRRLLSLVPALIAVLGLAACAGIGAGRAQQPTPAATLGALTVNDPWVRPVSPSAPAPTPNATAPAMGGALEMGALATTAGYLTIVNGGAESDHLVAAAAPAGLADAVELHSVVDEGGMMRMRPVERIELPAGAEVALRPGGFHIMLIGVRQELRAGDTVTLSLTFERAGTLEVDAVVRPATAAP